MRYRVNATVSYSVQVNISGIGMVLFALFGGGRSVHDVLIGGAEWGPAAQHGPWLEHEHNPLSGLLGGGTAWGTEVDSINWE